MPARYSGAQTARYSASQPARRSVPQPVRAAEGRQIDPPVRVDGTGKKKRFHFHPIDGTMVAIIVFLLMFGLVILYSASYFEASMSKGCNYDPTFYLKRQAIWIAGGLAVMLVVSFFPYRFLKKLVIPFYIFSLVLVVACLAFDPVNGARRWITVGSFQFQPSEIVKLMIILITALLIEKYGTGVRNFSFCLKVLLPAVIAAVMLYGITDNLSSAIIVLVIAVGMLFVARPDYRSFIVVLLIGVVFVTAGVMFINRTVSPDSENFRFRRVIAWLHPESSSSETAFQVMQALYAIGSGGFRGKGLGKSVQKLGYIPEIQNDMIFSVICEELGFIGAVVVISLFIMLCWRIMTVATRSYDVFGSYIAAGVFLHMAVQVFLNVAVATNTIPNTGVTLPFISYGGTSVLLTLAEMGLVLSVSRYADRKTDLAPRRSRREMRQDRAYAR